MAYLVEQAGGKAMAKPGVDILDIRPTHIHQRSPIFLGSAEDVDEVMKFIAEEWSGANQNTQSRLGEFDWTIQIRADVYFLIW